jgi:hypothetical protein
LLDLSWGDCFCHQSGFFTSAPFLIPAATFLIPGSAYGL